LLRPGKERLGGVVFFSNSFSQNLFKAGKTKRRKRKKKPVVELDRGPRREAYMPEYTTGKEKKD